MKIENLRTDSTQARPRVAATVIWEDCDRPTQEIHFETTRPFADGLCCNPHAFLTACIMPAMRHGERRLSMDAEICPELRNGLVTAMSWIRRWFEPERRLVLIEAKTSAHLLSPRTPERAGVFLSGGIDSLACLRANRLAFPLAHPGSFKDGLFINGIEKGKDAEMHKLALRSLAEIVKEDANLSLVPAYTNIRQLDDDSSFWGKEFQGAALSSVAHAFSRRLTTANIPATYSISNLVAFGSHPCLDPSYSSSDLRIRHDGILLSRLDKTRLVAEWDVALQNIRVCNNQKLLKPGILNCGQCEKCLRTKLGLLALGKLDKTRIFPKTDSEKSLLAKLAIANKPSYAYVESCYRELIPALAESGHGDLARGVERVLARSSTKTGANTSRERLKRIDQKLFNGNLQKLYKATGRGRKAAQRNR